MRRAAALIVGGGPAGAAAAIALLRAGVQPELIERSEGPRDVVCGGFLGWDALAALGRLGVDAAALGARPIRRLRLVSARRSVEVELPRIAAGLSRRTLDEALLAAASAAGARVTRGKAVRAAEPGRARLDDGEEIETARLVVATGKHELRGLARPVDLSDRPVGLRTSLRANAGLAAIAETIELHLFDGGYAGLLLQEDGSANLCLSVSQARLKAAGGVEPLLDELARELPAFEARLADGQASAWSAIAGVPYGWRARATEDGVFRIGDQASVIASLAGDGIAIALESGLALGRSVRRGDSAAEFQRRWHRRSARPVRVAEWLRSAAERPASRHALMGLLDFFPALAPLAARLTRIGAGA